MAIDKLFEDTDASFVDVDGDSDLDLYVVSGGNESKKNNHHLKDRLYLNNGKGIFTSSTDALPKIYANGSCVRPIDYDGDNDIDLFVGSRSITGIFGLSPDSYLLENDGKGNFRNVTSKKAKELIELGMITDAQWVDVNADNKPDLVVVGEYMAPEIFINENGKFKKSSDNGLNNLFGWWFSITPTDVNNDGKIDFVLGNMGENTNYKATIASPMKLYINDFDDNGTIEQICTHFIEGKDKPIHLKNELTKQITRLKKENLKFNDYAKRGIVNLFSEELLKNCQIKKLNYQKSCVAINKGDNTFEIIELPQKIQLSSVQSVICEDINKDGNIDLVLAGNYYHFKPQFARLDASYGEVLLGKGNGHFEVTDSKKTGFFIKGEVRDMKLLDIPDGKLLIAARNNENPKTFLLK